MTRKHLPWYNFNKGVKIEERKRIKEIRQRKAEKGQVKNEAIGHVE